MQLILINFQKKNPKIWKSALNCWTISTVNKFTHHLVERHSFLMQWLEEGTPTVFDARLLFSVKKLLEANMIDWALTLGKGIQQLSYKCKICEGYSEVGDDNIYLTNLQWAMGGWSGDEIKVDQDEPTFKTITALVFKIIS